MNETIWGQPQENLGDAMGASRVGPWLIMSEI